MSIRVELDELNAVAVRQAPFAYLLTVSDDGRAHAVAITPRIHASGAGASTADGGSITCDAGRRSCANARSRPNVSLLWPPAEPGDYSLIVDGTATVDGSTVQIVPERAVRHRPAPEGGSDCAPVVVTSEE
jgi:hypothetical protein